MVPAFMVLAVLELYDPDRSQTPRHLDRPATPATWDAFITAVAAWQADGVRGVRLLTGAGTSPTLLRRRFPELRWHVHEPVGAAAQRLRLGGAADAGAPARQPAAPAGGGGVADADRRRRRRGTGRVGAALRGRGGRAAARARRERTGTADPDLPAAAQATVHRINAALRTQAVAYTAPIAAAAEPFTDLARAMARGETATLVLVWAVLLALLGASAGVSFLHWGAWNSVLNLGIAVAKTALILWFYMHLRRTRPLVRLAGATAPLWLAILFGLALADYLTR